MQIQREENRKLHGTKEMTKELTSAINMLMKEQPMISASEIAKILSVSAESVRYRIKIMKRAGEIQRKGSTKKGRWEIMT